MIQGTDVDDTIEIAGGLDIDVEVRDTIDNDRMQDGRHGTTQINWHVASAINAERQGRNGLLRPELPTTPPLKLLARTGFWIRPMGLSWKLRVKSRQHADLFRSTLTAAGAECRHPASPSNTHEWLIFASFVEKKSHRELQPIIAAVLGPSLMHDPA